MSLHVIGVAFLLAIFAYPLSPDSSPDANRKIAELSARHAGFSRQFLKVPWRQPTNEGFFARLFNGTPQSYRFVPINSYFFARDTIIVAHYIKEGVQDTLAFPLQSLVKYHRSPAKELGRLQQQVSNEYIVRKTFLFGTDRYGRDILSRLLVGTRVSIMAGAVAVLLSLSIGMLLGVITGYCRGWLVSVVMYLINVLDAIPAPLLAFAITLSIGKGFWQIFIAIGLTLSVGTTRRIRGQLLVLRETGYVQAAHALGMRDTRIIVRHILPNIAGLLMAIAASNIAAAILMEAGLSFLGIGIQEPIPSWGLIIKEHCFFSTTNSLLPVLIPGIDITILAYAFNVLGSALRGAFDIRSDA